jgi:hypothetical protein
VRIGDTPTVSRERVGEPRRVHPGQLSPDTEATVDDTATVARGVKE